MMKWIFARQPWMDFSVEGINKKMTTRTRSHAVRGLYLHFVIGGFSFVSAFRAEISLTACV
jgi:hypothetical protein